IHIKLVTIVYNKIKESKNWYNQKRQGLGEDFKSAVNHKIEDIAHYSYHFQIKFSSVRAAFLNRFPYGIFFIIEQEKKQIVILGVMHTKRDPKTIYKRR